MHFTHSRSDGANTPSSRRGDLLRAAAPQNCRAAPRNRHACRAHLRTDAEALADVVAAALETDAAIDLRVNRGENDARFKRVSGRVVELKNKRLLQLTYKRRGACDLQRNPLFVGDDGAEGTDGDLLPPKRWSARKAVAHALVGRDAGDGRRHALRPHKRLSDFRKLRPGQEAGFTRPH